MTWRIGWNTTSAELGGEIYTPGGCAAFQRYLDRMEKWGDMNLMKFIKGPCTWEVCRPQAAGSQQQEAAGVADAGVGQHCSVPVTASWNQSTWHAPRPWAIRGSQGIQGAFRKPAATMVGWE